MILISAFARTAGPDCDKARAQGVIRCTFARQARLQEALLCSPVKTVRNNAARCKHLLFPALSMLALSLTLPFLSGIYPIARFARERIELYVRPGSITVIGYYVYKNPYPFPVVQGLSIPVPVDNDHPMPEAISVERLRPDVRDAGAEGKGGLDLANTDVQKTGGSGLNTRRGERMPLHYFPVAPRFELRFLPREEAVVKIRYTQKARVKKGIYLLTTTRPWQAPLEEGVYRIFFPAGVRITASNYRLKEYGKGVLGFHKTGFMPEEDWSFSWH